MTNSDDKQDAPPPIRVPQTDEEARRMIREAMAVSAQNAVDIRELGKKMEGDRAQRRAEWQAWLADQEQWRAQQNDSWEQWRAQQDDTWDKWCAQQDDTWDKWCAQQDDTWDKWCAQQDDAWDKTREYVQRVTKKSSQHEENSGRILEHVVASQAERIGHFAGVPAGDITPNLKKMQDAQVVREYDVLVRSDSELMLVEVKRVLSVAALEKLTNNYLRAFRHDFPEILGDRALYGAVAFELFPAAKDEKEQAMRLARDAGLCLVHVIGESELKVVSPHRRDAA